MTFVLEHVRTVIAGAVFGLLVSLTTPALADVKVVASIKPIHGLVAGVMKGVGTPSLLVEGGASPHSYSLRPSNARELQQADLIVWVGGEIEAFLKKPLATLGTGAEVIELIDLPNLKLMSYREDGPFASHDDDHDGDHQSGKHDDDHDDDHKSEQHDDAHHHDGPDAHIWLDPDNAKVIVKASAAALMRIDPANAEIYRSNAAVMISRLERLSINVSAKLKSIAGRNFVVFHDSYQYFEDRFGLKAVGSITVNPAVVPGAERIRDIQNRARSLGATCVFSEPQFPSVLISIIREGSNTKTGVLDPLGAALPSGPEMYFTLIEKLASSFHECLKS
ncbi:MAG: zinc ABC transporter substrate-binding protein [Alphaproteobacteria bacterium]|nr:zinc ABC transporter substrate-binding protein [Alphaproteobacteria bacterium]